MLNRQRGTRLGVLSEQGSAGAWNQVTHTQWQPTRPVSKGPHSQATQVKSGCVAIHVRENTPCQRACAHLHYRQDVGALGVLPRKPCLQRARVLHAADHPTTHQRHIVLARASAPLVPFRRFTAAHSEQKEPMTLVWARGEILPNPPTLKASNNSASLQDEHGSQKT